MHAISRNTTGMKDLGTCGWTGRGGSRGSVHMSLSSRLFPSRVPYTGVTATPYCEPGSKPDSVAVVPRAAYCLSDEELTAVETAWIRLRSTCNRSFTVMFVLIQEMFVSASFVQCKCTFKFVSAAILGLQVFDVLYLVEIRHHLTLGWSP